MQYIKNQDFLYKKPTPMRYITSYIFWQGKLKYISLYAIVSIVN